MQKDICLLSTQEIVETLLIGMPGPLFEEQEKKERKQNMKTFLEGLERAISYVPFKTEIKNREKAIKGLVSEYFSLMMREKYPLLSRKILNLKHDVELDISEYVEGSESDFQDFEIPVFASASIEKEVALVEEYVIKKGYREDKITLKAQMPDLNLKVREKAKEAVAYCHAIYGKALKMPLLGDLLLANPQNFPAPKDANLLVIWKPKPEDLKIEIEEIDKDPILTLDWLKNLYLITTWQTKDEEPFEYFLNEYIEK